MKLYILKKRGLAYKREQNWPDLLTGEGAKYSCMFDRNTQDWEEERDGFHGSPGTSGSINNGDH